ncbi:hypothetical protein [Bradyrhizobium guangdongense]
MFRWANDVSDFTRCAAFAPVGLVLLCLLAQIISAQASNDQKNYPPKFPPATFFSGADRFESLQGDPPVVAVYRRDQLQGFVYLHSDFASATGYSGKPIYIPVGVDANRMVNGLKLVDHHDPIGIPQARIVAAVHSQIGKDMQPVTQGTQYPPQVDTISCAPLTVLVMSDSIVRSAVRLIRTGRVGGGQAITAAAAIVERVYLADRAGKPIELVA